jgi:chromosome segregation protein
VFLKSIDIHGFKTFADKTSLLFRPGVTAIVGPNGCGKSNIVDAIRWVLGESNARSLRGEVMEDVIFAGSDEQKPLGMSEVSLTIVNDDALLPIEYSEVTVKRRLYRSGESEFFINRNPVRLKDIHELFADTGIGKPAYSIMEQGNIDVLLSNRPEERMLIFEEAAGITRYKMKIRESYRKLTATDENLIRLNIIIREVEKEFHNLERQAERAAIYRRLKQEEIRLETLYNYERVRSLQSQIGKNDAQREKLKEQRETLHERIESLNLEIKNSTGRVRALENEIMEIRNEIYRKDASLEAIDLKISHMGERIREIEGEIAKKRGAIADFRERKRELEERIGEQERHRHELQQLITSQEEKLQSYLSEVSHIDEVLEKNRQRVAGNIQNIEAAESELIEQRDELRGVIDRLIREIDEVKIHFSESEEEKNRLVDKIHKTIQTMESVLKFHAAKLRDLEYSASDRGFKPLVQELGKEIESLKEVVAELHVDFDRVTELQNVLSRVLFGKEGPHAQKEIIEGRIDALLARQEGLKDENDELGGEISRSGERKEEFETLINNLRPDMAANRVHERNAFELIKRLRSDLETSEEQLRDREFEIESSEGRMKALQKDIDTLSQSRSQIEEHKRDLTEKIRVQNSHIDRILKTIHRKESELEKGTRKSDEVSRSTESLDIRNAELHARIESIFETFKERYSQSLELFEPDEEVGDLRSINEKRVQIRNEISALGQINPMAIEEFEEVRKRYEYLTAQRLDLEKAKEDLNRIVEKTLQTSKELFMQSFESIRANFNSIFRRLFGGGKTDLFLTNEANIFDTGVEILAYPPGKSPKRRSLLSGGEKSLTAIALLFSIFMVKPSPFCMLDEVDHDLDEENVVRFLKLLKEFTDTTQFIIITHNRRTIEFADVIYGVTAEQLGVSKVLSLELMEQAVE